MTSNAPRPQDNYQRAILVGIIVWVLYCLLTATGCATPKPLIQYRDSVRVEVRERVVRDTAYYTIVGDSQSVTTQDTTSTLRNAYAVSNAAIRGGNLHHDLRTFPQLISIPVGIEVSDTLIFHEKTEVQRVEVERTPTKWEGFIAVCGYILLVLVVGVAAVLVLRLVLRR